MSSQTPSNSHTRANSLSRQLGVYFLLAIVFVAGLLLALNQLAGLMGTATQEAQAVDFANNRISAVLREEPPQLDSSKTTEAGITNPLDGLYADKGTAEAIEQAAMIAQDKGTLTQLYNSLCF